MKFMTTWFGNFLRRRRSKGLFSRSALPSFTRRADGKSDMASAQVSEHVSRALWRAACDDVPATLVRLRSSESGLRQQEAEERLERHGPNEVDHEKPLAWWQHLWQCYSNPFNILLTVPFGVYLRYFFKASRKQTVILTLALSLFYELTQLSGLYFIYPRPYRLADVDDLITNTLGGYLGYLIAPKITAFLPSADRMKEVAYQRSEHVSILRRMFAAALDCLILEVLFFVVMINVLPLLPSLGEKPLSVFLAVLLLFGFYTLFVMLYFGVLEWLMGGRSQGKLFFHLKLIDTRTGGRPKLWQYLVRYGFFYLLVVPLPFLALLMFFVQDDGLALVLGIILGALFLAFCIAAVVQSGLKGNQLPHGYFSKTKDVSTLNASRQRKARKAKKAPSELPKEN